MKVLVTLPNGRTTYCVDVRSNPKTLGRECLEKVFDIQEIKCETEYFGLVYVARRNRSQRTSSSSSSGPDHGQLTPNATAAATTISPASSPSTSPFHNASDSCPASNPIICDPETETPQWLNLRNPLPRCDGFLKMALRVKFWVPVHLMLQESVRNLFYMEARRDLLENRTFASDWTNVVKLAGLLAHADGVRFNAECLENNRPAVAPAASDISLQPQQQRRRGSKRKSSEPGTDAVGLMSHSPLSVYEPYAMVRPNPKVPMPIIPKDQLLRMIAEEHQKYADQKTNSAKYWLLAEYEKLDGFGEEKFVGDDASSTHVEISVGPEGVVHTRGTERTVIPFSAIHRASSKKRVFRLKYLNQANKDDELVIKMTPALCTALYRSVTEKHDFYSCETVRTDVHEQFIRDFKGTFLSIFNEDTEKGKMYVFDIQRTCREVHEHASRYLHQNGIKTTAADLKSVLREESDVERSKQIQEEVTRRIEQMVSCRICYASYIDAVFTACGHVISCMSCAVKCGESCPMCRTKITSISKLYLPTDLRGE